MLQMSMNCRRTSSKVSTLVRVVTLAVLAMVISTRVVRAQSAPAPLRILTWIHPENPLQVRFELKNAEANKARVKVWRFGDRTRSLEVSPTHSYAKRALYGVRVRYFDLAGVERELGRELSLVSPPTVLIESFGQVEGGAATALWFQALAKSESTQVNAQECRWGFGDGTTAVGARVEHTYGGPGAFAVDVTLVDSVGNVVTDGVDVTVREPPPPPPPAPLPPPPEPETDRLTIWPGTARPSILDSGDSMAYELGVRFRVSTPGSILGLRYHKSVANTGKHTGHLWDERGMQLGAVEFTQETASGWQEATFAVPIQVQPDSTYTASYFVPVGRYSVTLDFFSAQALPNPLPKIYAVDSAFAFGSTAFPTQKYRSSNYWVDVVFTTRSIVVPPPTPIMVVCDFETVTEGIDGTVLKQSSDAHQGKSSLSMDLNSGAVLHSRLWSFLLPRLLSFAFVERAEAVWFSKWDGVVSFDMTKVRPALEAYLAAHPSALSLTQTQKVWALADAFIAAGPAFPKLAAGEWHCLGASYEFPSATGAGVLKLRLGNVVFLALQGFSILDDDKALGALIEAMVAGKAVMTTGTTSWLDDLKISNQPVGCP